GARGYRGYAGTFLLGSQRSRNRWRRHCDQSEKGIAWNFRLYPPHRKMPAGPLRGLFWLPNEDAKGFVAVQNASEEFITLTPQIDVAGGTYPLPSRRVAPGQGLTLEVRDTL